MNRATYTAALGVWIRENRVGLDLSQAELATAVDASESSISNWETGVGVLSAFSYQLLRTYFGRRWEERGGAGRPEPPSVERVGPTKRMARMASAKKAPPGKTVAGKTAEGTP